MYLKSGLSQRGGLVRPLSTTYLSYLTPQADLSLRRIPTGHVSPVTHTVNSPGPAFIKKYNIQTPHRGSSYHCQADGQSP